MERHPYLRHEVIPIDHSDVQLYASLLAHLLQRSGTTGGVNSPCIADDLDPCTGSERPFTFNLTQGNKSIGGVGHRGGRGKGAGETRRKCLEYRGNGGYWEEG